MSHYVVPDHKENYKTKENGQPQHDFPLQPTVGWYHQGMATVLQQQQHTLGLFASVFQSKSSTPLLLQEKSADSGFTHQWHVTQHTYIHHCQLITQCLAIGSSFLHHTFGPYQPGIVHYVVARTLVPLVENRLVTPSSTMTCTNRVAHCTMWTHPPVSHPL